MKKILLISCFISTIGTFSTVHAGEWCGPTKVKSVEANKDGLIWFKFVNGTQFSSTEAGQGLKNVMAIALSAYASNSDVKIYLNTPAECQADGNATSWEYLKIGA